MVKIVPEYFLKSLGNSIRKLEKIENNKKSLKNRSFFEAYNANFKNVVHLPNQCPF
jgi:hypothetical protein